MGERVNEYGQPIGAALPSFTPRPRPPRSALEGRLSRLEPIDPARHARPLYEALAEAPDQRAWTYLPYGPFADAADYRGWLERDGLGDDPQLFAILRRADARPLGVAGYLRIAPEVGVLEVGHLQFSPALQRSAGATEAMYLMMRRAFELGYRRYEWKCDALNAPSRRAAERLGFRFEGIFRQATVYKQRSRDTAWFSVIDAEWPVLRRAFERWLAEENFEPDGTQRRGLRELQHEEATRQPGAAAPL